VDPALIAAVISGGAAILSGFFAGRARREAEELRQGGEALSRLHAATGALRLELFLETRSFARRLVHYSDTRKPGHPYPLATEREAFPASEYHAGGLMIYRMLRPLTVGEIIEKQTFDADLIVDPIMVDLLRFSHAGVEMLTGDRLGEGVRPGETLPGFEMEKCWDPGRSGSYGRRLSRGQQHEGASPPYQRVRGSYLRCAAAALLARDHDDGSRRRCMTHAEFCERWEKADEHPTFHAALVPAKRIFHEFSPAANPHFWLRLVAYAYTCEWFYDRARADATQRSRRERWVDTLRGEDPIEYTSLDIPVPGMLEAAAGDGPTGAYLVDNAALYKDRFQAIIDTAL
jgi:hypothetical protein